MPAPAAGDVRPRVSRPTLAVTMETGGEFPAGNGRMVRIPRGEVRLCASCARAGIRGEKLGLFEPAG